MVHLSLKANRSALPYATALTLNAAGFNVARSIKPGTATELNVDGVLVDNDTSICRVIAQSANNYQELLGATSSDYVKVEQVLSECEMINQGLLKAADVFRFIEFSSRGTVLESGITAADLAIFAHLAEDEALRKKYITLFDAVLNDKRLAEAHRMVGKFVPAKAECSKATAKSTPVMAKPAGGNKEKQKDEGKFVELPGAEKGKVVVRFPPEASGYLHIGHAKAALLNQYYQQAFDGKLIMRFDDTNPAKENAHFEQVIKEDLKLLNIVPDMWSHSSDHFELMLTLCEKLLKEGKAFVDDTDTETMRKEREDRVDSRNRNTPPEENLHLWEEMKKGSERGLKCCVRIKIDMQSNNGALRDPTIYRCKPEEHVRTGTKYKVYPTYDFTCPIVDSIEGVTHALRTTEYHDRDDQYYFICDALDLRKPHIWEYARLNMTNTVMSKRKLTWFVQEGHVEGWSDPRFPTVRGVMRRGMTVEGLKQFIVAQGGSRSVVMMEWDKIWAFNKKVIDPVAPRYTALETTHVLVPVVINPAIKDEQAQVPLHPKDAAVGTKTIWRSASLLVEQVDARAMKKGDTVTFVNWGNLKIDDVVKNGNDATSIAASLDLENQDFKKTLKVTWIAEASDAASKTIPVVTVDYDHIISKAIIGKDEDWKNFINYDSAHYTNMIGEPALRNVKQGDIIQLQRKGFYICDRAYNEKSEFSGEETPLLLICIPDGKVKEAPATGLSKTATTKTATPSSSANDVASLYKKVEDQGALVRDLKAKDAKSQATKDVIAQLLKLKEEYKKVTGSEWKPGQAPVSDAPVANASASGSSDAASLYKKVEDQGDLVRELKAKDAKSQAVKDAVAQLLKFKEEYKNATGSEWKTRQAPAQ